MSRGRLLALLVLGLVVLHFLLHVGLGFGREAPDLLTLALLLVVRETRLGAAAALGFLLGIMEDAFSALAFGAGALAMTVVGILGSRTRDLFVGDSVRFLFAYLGIGKLLRDLIYWLAAGEALREPFVTGVLLHGGLGALYMAAVGVCLHLLMGGSRSLP